MSKHLLKNISWVFFERVSQVIGAFAISGIISRQLGVDAYGDFQYALSLIIIFSSFGLLCSSEVLLPKISSANGMDIHRLIAVGFVLRFGAALVGYLILFAYACIFEKNQNIFILLSVIGLTLFLREPFAVFTIYYQSLTSSKPIVVGAVFVLILKILILSVAYWFDLIDFKLLSVVWIFEAAVLAIIYSILYFRKIKDLFYLFEFCKTDITKIAREGFLYMLPLVLILLFLKADRILVRNMTSDYEAGIYMAGMQLFDAAISVATIASVALAPSLIYKNFSKIEIRKNMKKLLQSMFFLGCAISMVGYFFTPLFVRFIFGFDFVDSIEVAQVAFFISILVFIDSSLNVYLIKQGDFKFSLIKWIIVVAIALPIEYFSIVYWGAQAAQIGIAVGYIVAIFLGAYKLKSDYDHVKK